MGFDGVCICKAAAEPLGYLPLQQLPENQKDVQKQKPFLRSEVDFIEIQNGSRQERDIYLMRSLASGVR